MLAFRARVMHTILAGALDRLCRPSRERASAAYFHGDPSLVDRLSARASYRWERFDDDALLRLRFRDLRLEVPGSFIEADTQRLAADLDARGIRFKPHFWFST